MTRHSFDEQLAGLRHLLLEMSTETERSMERTITALQTRNTDLAREIIANDDVIDQYETRIEEACLELIARQQPLAADLRLISMILKMITDLERIADHSSDISEIILRLGSEEPIKPLVDIPHMAEIARQMVHDAIVAYLENDLDKAKAVSEMDDEVDRLFEKVILDLSTMMKADPSVVDRAMDLLFIAKYLERVGDHATNVAEWVAFNITGKHRHLSGGNKG